ncbi:hypothetical protein U879_07275 [Defluviimonas sp. 20V17]|uniref:Membrane fusion protein (MFP) family protein n=1 Tax=Allgaiera indica TaxID=765699 RepID=A0AAN4UVQ6_9RHOB|nr:HlyD family type I secretion periplasmic adaptor subunit [Allgaiera indica]KDB04345.1 hypothetical protein U879_07275 [Defluviimonas sp. 20V17]GHE06365.1 HlyD family type I secretion periplasmic adaptor subunit [Allgaiera indica]SDX90027.1 HlyD family secretion protein/membrane fusion protein, adhesin transport system [Allgaiera indica]
MNKEEMDRAGEAQETGADTDAGARASGKPKGGVLGRIAVKRIAVRRRSGADQTRSDTAAAAKSVDADGETGAEWRGASSAPQDFAAELTRPILIEETVPQAFVRRTSLLIAGGILTFIVWSALAMVHEVSRAEGTILPSGFERVVQHLEGGIVQSIDVREGAHVQKGQPLVRLQDATSVEDTAVLDEQSASMRARIATLEALLTGKNPDFGAIDDVRVRTAAQGGFTADADAERARRALLDSQIDQARHNLAVVERQIEGNQETRLYLADAFDRTEALFARGYSTRNLLAERRNARARADNEGRVLQERRRVAADTLERARRNLEAFRAETRAERTRRLEEARNALAALEGERSKKWRRLERLAVRAPVDGRVKSLDVTTLGGVVEAGQKIATIVPEGEDLIAEARIAVNQIGYVREGLPAQVKVSTYDFTRFGWIDATVDSISPAAFRDPGGAQYFKVRLRLSGTSPNHAPAARISPGMEFVADIITGQKTVLAYLLSPVRKAFSYSFAER